MAPQPVQRQLGRFAQRIPQRDVERRHRHGGDAAAAERDGGLPQILPDRLDRAGILADDARDDHFVEAGDDGSDAGPEQEQIAHAGDATFCLDIDHQEVAGVAESVALEPRRLRPRHAQHGGADGCDGYVAHGRISLPFAAMLRKSTRGVNRIACGSSCAARTQRFYCTRRSAMNRGVPMPKTQIISPKLRQPSGHFSHATMVAARGRFVFISGMTARRADGTIAGIGDIEAQTRQVCENVKAAVEQAGGTMDDICRVDVYVRNMEHFDLIHKIRRDYFKAPAPASTMVEVCKMTSPDYLIEINAIAVIGE